MIGGHQDVADRVNIRASGWRRRQARGLTTYEPLAARWPVQGSKCADLRIACYDRGVETAAGGRSDEPRIRDDPGGRPRRRARAVDPEPAAGRERTQHPD